MELYCLFNICHILMPNTVCSNEILINFTIFREYIPCREGVRASLFERLGKSTCVYPSYNQTILPRLLLFGGCCLFASLNKACCFISQRSSQVYRFGDIFFVGWIHCLLQITLFFLPFSV